MANPNYPADTLNKGVNLTIDNGNTWHQILNGADDETFEVDDGSVPSLRKSMKDNFYYKDPIDWVQNDPVTEFNQLVKFTDGTLWVAPTARANNPILMGVTPVGDDLWKISFVSEAAAAERSAASAIESAGYADNAEASAIEAANQVDLFANSSGVIIGTNIIATQNLVLGFHPLY